MIMVQRTTTPTFESSFILVEDQEGRARNYWSDGGRRRGRCHGVLIRPHGFFSRTSTHRTIVYEDGVWYLGCRSDFIRTLQFLFEYLVLVFEDTLIRFALLHFLLGTLAIWF